MKKIIITAIGVFLLIGAHLLTPPEEAAAQSWQSIGIEFKDSKDRGKLSARYKTDKTSSAKNGCRTTVELKNESGKPIMSYSAKLSFKEGDSHEKRGSYLSSGSTVQWVYENCGVKGVQISDVK